MIAAILALVASAGWGAGDYLGGTTSRRLGVLRVLLWSQVAMFVLMWLFVAIVPNVQIELSRLVIGVAGGVVGVIGLGALYRALATGPMALVPPIAATGVALPVVVGLLNGSSVSAIIVGALIVACVGVVLAAMGGSSESDIAVAGRIAPRTLALALLAAVCFAIVFVALDAAAGDALSGAITATAAVRTGSVITLLIALVITRVNPLHGIGRSDLRLVVAIGMLDTGANLAFAAASTLGNLAIVALLGSLFPAVTSGMAHVLLGERLSRLQFVGVVLVMAGVLVLSAAGV
jgi:drug/metabolite transporter (DMT)-like permease